MLDLIMIPSRVLVCSILALLAACASGASTAGGDPPVGDDALAPDMGAFRVYRGDGRPARVAAIVDQMEVDVEDRRRVVFLRNDVAFPNFFEECACPHEDVSPCFSCENRSVRWLRMGRAASTRFKAFR